MPSAPTGPGPGPAKSSGYTGRVVARCHVGERLGRGATSHVFRALYDPLGKDIALKILATKEASSADTRGRFLSEARAVAKLNHENIVKVLDVVEDQGLLCILMELVNGPTLQDRLDDEGVIPPRQAFRIAAQIARALEAAHAESLVHRDVKPANVILAGRPGDETVKVVDFGLAAQQEMNRVGTPLFMSPEAAQGKRIDDKSDVYALGVCLYRMLTGALPFTGATVKDILAAQVNAELVPPSVQRPQLGKGYDDLLKKLLVKSKGYRPTAGEAADLLEDVADDLEEREVGVRRVRKRKKRAPKKAKPVNPGVWAGLAVAALVVVGLFMALSGGDKPKDPTTTGSVNKPPPDVVVFDPAKAAFDDVAAWVAAHPADAKETARRWADVAQRFPGTSWGTSAGMKADEAKALTAKEAAPFSTRPQPPQAPVTRTEDPSLQHAKLAEAQKAFDWAKAYALMDQIEEAPPGVSNAEWDRRILHVEILSKLFVDKMDAGLKAAKRPVKAKDVFPDAKDGETLVGARSTGAVISNGKDQRIVSWSTASHDAFFKRGVIVDNVLDTNDFDSVMVLADLAAELGQPEKTVRRYRDNADGLAGSDEARAALVKRHFGE